jgi:hypothetical protein
MITRIWSIGVLSVLLFAVALGAAQESPNVKITQGPRVEDVTPITAIIAWSTNVNAGTVVKYGTDPKNLDQTAQSPWGGFTHRVLISNLKPDTTYYFQAESGQAQGTGTSVTSGISQFHTKPAGTK